MQCVTRCSSHTHGTGRASSRAGVAPPPGCPASLSPLCQGDSSNLGEVCAADYETDPAQTAAGMAAVQESGVQPLLPRRAG